MMRTSLQAFSPPADVLISQEGNESAEKVKASQVGIVSDALSRENAMPMWINSSITGCDTSDVRFRADETEYMLKWDHSIF